MHLHLNIVLFSNNEIRGFVTNLCFLASVDCTFILFEQLLILNGCNVSTGRIGSRS